MTVPEFIKEFDPKATEPMKVLPDVVSVAGRISKIRAMGPKLIFIDIV